jgi:hypothetical protein
MSSAIFASLLSLVLRRIDDRYPLKGSAIVAVLFLGAVILVVVASLVAFAGLAA